MICTDIPYPSFFIFSNAVSPLLYYSHIPTALIALFLSAYVLLKSRTLASELLFIMAILFSAWNFVDLVLWTNVDSGVVMAFWSTVYVIQTLILASAWYFSRAFLDGKDIGFRQKVVMGILLSPLIILMPTTLNLSGFDLANCEAQQGILMKYFYLFQGITLLWIFGYLIKKYRGEVEKSDKRKIVIFSLGIFFFLVAFSWGNVFGSLTLEWGFEQYGLFGMPVFISFLAFLIVKYNAFDIKLIGAQALVFALAVLTGSQIFFVKTTANFILTGITLLLVAGFGYFLIRSVKEEVRRKEELQEMATKLALTNEELRKLDNTKSEFISIASHQLRTPLTAIKGFLSLVLEGSYGKLSAEVEDVLNKVYSANNHLVDLVENLLNISRIESGRIQYVFVKADIAGVIHELADAFSVIAKGRNLKLDFIYPETPIPPFLMDSQKIREVISNMIDNALKYTQQGDITVRLTTDSEKVRVSVKDTGVGIAPEDLPILFQKFRRGKESGKVNVSGTGLGLYVGKSFAEAHGGRMFVESEGVGKGSTFTLELPFRTEDGLGRPAEN